MFGTLHKYKISLNPILQFSYALFHFRWNVWDEDWKGHSTKYMVVDATYNAFPGSKIWNYYVLRRFSHLHYYFLRNYNALGNKTSWKVETKGAFYNYISKNVSCSKFITISPLIGTMNWSGWCNFPSYNST